eukprot:scaffold113270_cov48-Phaeocystis_antarctica.AAC.1
MPDACPSHARPPYGAGRGARPAARAPAIRQGGAGWSAHGGAACVRGGELRGRLTPNPQP